MFYKAEWKVTFDNVTVIYGEGDALTIPDGKDHRHKAKIATEKAV